MTDAARVTQELLRRISVAPLMGDAQSSPLCIVASISNLRRIATAYGASLSSTVRRAVLQRARELCKAENGFAAASGEHVLCVFECVAGPESAERLRRPDEAYLSDRVVDLLGGGIDDGEGCVVYPAIVTMIVPPVDTPITLDELLLRQHHEGSLGWRYRYVADMRMAEELLEALDRDELCFSYEKVCSAKNPDFVSYYEVLLRRKQAGVAVTARDQIGALERLGLISRLDRWVVTSVIDTLRAHSQVSLGCNVSMQSVTLDGWWPLVIERLAREPNVASRLVIELTETATLAELGPARDLIKVLQLLGCRIALDDVGSGQRGIGSLSELGADIIKIDRSIVRRARESGAAGSFVKSVVDLASACAKEVVIEGVECEDDLQLCRASAVHWVQGHLFAPLTSDDFEYAE